MWFSGGKLAADLTLPKLRHRWAPATTTGPNEGIAPAERNAVYDYAARSARDAALRIRHFAATDPAAAADAAWATADTLRAAAGVVHNKELRRAADSYDRAARCAYGRVPRPSVAGHRLRTAARLLSTTALGTGDPVGLQLRLIVQLLALAEAVAELRAVQRHSAQAAAARTAAAHLHAARCRYGPPGTPANARAPGAADAPSHRASRDFPIPLREALATARGNEPASVSRASPGHAPPRRRGPAP